MWGIIGGSGFENFEEFETVEELSTETPFGATSSGIKKVKVAGQEALFISRHGKHHEDLPTEVNFRANIYALKKYGAKAIVSFSAIGSLKKECKPGDLVVPNQYIDRTKGVRAHTFLGEGLVGHVSLAQPTSSLLTERLMPLCEEASWKEHKADAHFKQTYVCIEGPYFSTQAESNFYRSMGADIIGMTHFPEFALAREAGLPYLPCCFVTDYDCWDDSIPHVTLEEVIEVMRKNNVKAFSLLKLIFEKGSAFYEGCETVDQGLRTGLFTPPEAIPSTKKEWLKVLTD